MACVSGTAQAQQPPASSSAAAAGDTLGAQDIIVTAQRRDESLSKTPVSVAVVTADTLAKAQVVSEQDLRIATPGLSVRGTFTSNQLNYSLRGQSKDAFSGTTPGVLPYINEVQIGGSGGASAFYDLQSVQVLKGPQGTLFGRSATGGAVLFTTAKPTDQFGGYASASYGNYDALNLEGAINLPIAGDMVMARVAGFYQKRDGFQRNLFDGGREGDLDRFGLRGSLTLATGAFRNELVIDYLHANDENTLGVIAGLMPFDGAGSPYIPLEFLYAGTSTPVARATGIATLQAFVGNAVPPAAVAGFYDAYFASPNHPAVGLRGYLGIQNARSPYVIDSDASNFYRARNVIVTNTSTYEVGDGTTIKNIFGYTHLPSRNAFDVEGTPYGIFSEGVKGTTTSQDFTTTQFSEELQLLGKGLNDRLNYVIGGYYMHDRTRTQQFNTSFDLLFGGATQNLDYTITTRTLAAYAQGTLQLNDSGLAATAGARYTSERAGVSFGAIDQNLLTAIALGNGSLPPGYATSQRNTTGRVSWTLGLQDQLTPDLLVYAASRRAYKSAGFNGTSGPKTGLAAIGGNAFGTETVTDAELGTKFNGRLGEMPARLNLAAFHNWISDNQRTTYTIVNGNPASVTANVPRARTWGVEFDTQVKPIDWLTVGGNVNYIHAKFTRGLTTANGITELFDRVPDTPRWSAVVFADVSVPVSGDWSLLLHGDAYRQTKTFTYPVSDNGAGTRIGGYTLANFRIGVEDKPSGLTITANLKNAFKKIYYVGGIPLGEILQINTFVPGEPRTITVEARLKF